MRLCSTCRKPLVSKADTIGSLTDGVSGLHHFACIFPQARAEALKHAPPEADLPAMTEPLSAQVADHMRKLTAELREAQRRIADLEAGMRRMQDEAAARGVELATPTPSASS